MATSNWLPLRSIRVNNYKSIVDSGKIELSPFTLLIGNNGSGKSSLIEAIELLRSLATAPLDETFRGSKAIEHIVHKGRKKGKLSKQTNLNKVSERLKFSAAGRVYGSTTDAIRPGSAYQVRCELAKYGDSEGVRVADELVSIGGAWSKFRHLDCIVEGIQSGSKQKLESSRLPLERTLLEQELGRFFIHWQMLGLVPEIMGLPVTKRLDVRVNTMNRDGSDVAEALHRLANGSEEEQRAFWSIDETMRSILGYGERVEPRQDLGAIASRFIEFDEGGYTVPGWMLSTGTIRLVALLIALRRPQPPTLLCIEEIENGLDPRTLGLVMDEIKFLTRSKKLQVIATTHSPHLLDQVDLDQVLFVQRREGAPHFLRPSESSHVEGFRDHFSPGRLYTMGVLSEAARQLQ
ncbi:MAG: ATP-binding protein [Armatimonadetes bacterium]|nr:ATP-binding protein [Armatimonadota bacterium]